MIEFVVKQCALDANDKSLAKLSTDDICPDGLRDMSNQTLQLITTTIVHMEKVLWPYLLEFLVPVQYTLSVGIVCKCVADIAIKKKDREDDDYTLNFDELGKDGWFIVAVGVVVFVMRALFTSLYMCVCVCMYSKSS